MNQTSLLDVPEAVPFEPVASVWRAAPILAFERWIRITTYEARSGRVRRGYSEASQRAYRSIFGGYVDYLQMNDTSVLEAKPHHVDAFMQNLTGRESGGRASYETTRRTLTLLDLVHTHLSQSRIRAGNPVKPLFAKYTREPDSRPMTTVLTSSQHEALIDHITSIPRHSFTTSRRAALLALLAGCGVTGNDLRTLAAADVALNESPPQVRMPQVGARANATIALADFAVPVVVAYAAYRKQSGVDSKLFFPTTLGRDRPLSHQTLHRYVLAALKAVGLDKRIGAQRILRATLAVRLLAHLPDQDVKEILRLHSDKMIDRYRRHVVKRMPF